MTDVNGVDRTTAGIDVVELVGENDLSTSAQVERQIGEAISAGRGVVVDMTEATFIDSAVLRVLLSGQDRAATVGVGFAIALGTTTGHAVRRLLELTGLSERLVIATGRTEAVAKAAEANPASR